MSIKGIVSLFEDIRESGIEGLQDDGLNNRIDDVLEELKNNSEFAQEVLLERMDEKQFIKLMLMVQKMVATLAATEGNMGILFAEMDSSLQSYTQTVILTTIGTLMQEEIL